MKILVTGGTGVVGLGVVPELIERGHTVKLLSRHAKADAKVFSGAVEAVEADIGDPASLESTLKGCDAVVHLAGIVEESGENVTFERINVGGTRNLLAQADVSERPAFIYMSSLGADVGDTPYHRSKRDAEAAVKAYAGQWVILRPGAVYGPGDETISTLFKMMRSLPAVPIVRKGDQPFQPLWYRDLGYAVAEIIADLKRFDRRAVALAGNEVTNTTQVLDQIAELIQRDPPRIGVPEWLAQVGTRLMDAGHGAGHRALKSLGLDIPINSSELGMLLEGNVVPEGVTNSLATEFVRPPIKLEDGMKALSKLSPEQLPGDGVGSIKHATYSAEIESASCTAQQLLEKVCDDLDRVMPINFAAEQNSPHEAKKGETMTAKIPGRGNAQVRLEEKTEARATFATLEGHPLAGVMQLHSEQLEGKIRFSVHTASQAADVFDWMAMKTAGSAIQDSNWQHLVERVIGLSGGVAPRGVETDAHSMTDDEVKTLRKWIEKLVERELRARLKSG